MHRFIISVFLALVACAITVGPARAGLCQEDVCVRIEPVVSLVQVNDLFSIQIIADINRSIVGWGLDFNESAAGIVSQQGGPSISPNWFAATASDGDGLAGLAFPDSISGNDIVLATLSLHADAPGETDLLLSTTAADLTEGFAIDPTGFATAQFSPGHVTVIPEPGLAAILIGVFVLARRIRSA